MVVRFQTLMVGSWVEKAPSISPSLYYASRRCRISVYVIATLLSGGFKRLYLAYVFGWTRDHLRRDVRL